MLSKPLTWDSITLPSKLMLPTYLGLFSVMGYNYTFGEIEGLIAGPGLRYANSLPLDLRQWGVMFFTAASLMVVAICKKRRSIFRYALWWGAICLFIWAGVFASAAVWGDGTPGAWAPWFALGVACLASDRSLLHGEK